MEKVQNQNYVISRQASVSYTVSGSNASQSRILRRIFASKKDDDDGSGESFTMINCIVYTIPLT